MSENLTFDSIKESSSNSSEFSKGLKNLNYSICFMSSVLQVLFKIFHPSQFVIDGPVTKAFFELRCSRSIEKYEEFKNLLEI